MLGTRACHCFACSNLTAMIYPHPGPILSPMSVSMASSDTTRMLHLLYGISIVLREGVLSLHSHDSFFCIKLGA